MIGGDAVSHFTRDAIKDSFIKMLGEKRLDHITVKDIVVDCGVSRKTFYYYFEDIYDLLEKCMADLTRESLEHVVDLESFEKELLKLVEFVMNNKKAVYHLYYSLSRETMEDYLFNSSIVPIKEVVRHRATGTGCSEEDIEILSKLCANAFTSCVLRWIKEGMKTDFEYVLRRISVMFDGAFTAALKNAADYDKEKM